MRAAPAAPVVAAGLLLLVILAFATLVVAGRWQADEYEVLGALRLGGFDAFLERLLNWSPRPVSEGLIALYALAVEAAGQPLVAPCLALAWALVLTSLYLAARGTGLAAPALLATALFAAFYLMGKPGEMFFWPMAALAYLPTLAGIAVAQLVEQRQARSRSAALVQAAALAVAAGATEAGAIYVVLSALLRLAVVLAGRRRAGDAATWAGPAVLAAGVLVMVAVRRGPVDEVMLRTSPALGDPLAALALALPDLFDTLTGPGVLGLATKILLFLGLWALRPAQGSARGGAMLQVASLLATGLAMLVLSYMKFGTACCERHETFRQAMVVLALQALAVAMPARRGGEMRAAVLLGVPLLVLAAARLPQIAVGWRLAPAVAQAQAATWASAGQPGPLQFHNPPLAPFLSAWVLPAGRYEGGSILTPGPVGNAARVMLFFDKPVVEAHGP